MSDRYDLKLAYEERGEKIVNVNTMFWGMVSVFKSILYSSFVRSLSCTLYNVSCTLYNVLCTLYVQCIVYSILCTVLIVQCIVYIE